MVLRQGSGTDNVAPVCGLAWIDVDDRDDTGGTGFDADTTSLIELECENVFVVGKRDDKLDNELATTGDNSPTSPPISMFPVDAVVLLVNADDIWRLLAGAVGINDYAIEVFDHPKAVAAQLQIVCTMAKATVTEVEGLLTVEGWTWVGIWDALFLVSYVGACQRE